MFGMGTGGPSSPKTPTYDYVIAHSFHSVLVLYTKCLRLSIGFIKLFNIFLLERSGCAQIVQFVCRKGRNSKYSVSLLVEITINKVDGIYKKSGISTILSKKYHTDST